jgi:vacuolar-type H+-ATPase subunit B/Vma2
MTDSESLANSLDQKFNELIQLHQESLTKIVALETELEEQKKKVAKNSDLFEQKFNEQLKSQEILKQENLHENKEIKQAIGKLIEEIDDCMDYISLSKDKEKDKQ